MQEKAAFLWVYDHWQLPLVATPTSHIFEPAIKESPTGADFSDSPWNEWLCLTLCRAFRLEAAKANVHHFDDKPVIVVERFDRVRREDALYRLPQEDICQAFGFPPNQKYQSDGGPSMKEIFELLDSTIAPYPEFPIQNTKMAMSFGNKRYYRLSQIHPRNFRQTGKNAGMHAQDTDDILSELIDRKDKALAETEALAVKTGVPNSTSESIFDGLMKRFAIIEADRIRPSSYG